jgi:hypothetical protein
MNKKSFRSYLNETLAFVTLCLLIIAPISAQQNNPEKSLKELFKSFITAKKYPCGQRSEAIKIGRELIQKFGDKNTDNVVNFYIKKDVAKIEEEEKNCKTDDSPNSLKNLYENFKKVQLSACGKRDEAIRIGNQIVKKFGNDEQSKYFVEQVKRQIPIIEMHEKECRSIDSLETLFNRFKQNAKPPCGERSETISFGKFIIEKFSDDELNKDVINFIKKRVTFLENDEKSCVPQGDFYESSKKL